MLSKKRQVLRPDKFDLMALAARARCDVKTLVRVLEGYEFKRRRDEHERARAELIKAGLL
jgi:hypothetical protein